MSTKVWEKIDRFYLLLAVVLVIMAGFIIFTFRGIFSAIAVAYEVDIVIPNSELRINKEKMDEANTIVFEKEIVPLEIR